MINAVRVFISANIYLYVYAFWLSFIRNCVGSTVFQMHNSALLFFPSLNSMCACVYLCVCSIFTRVRIQSVRQAGKQAKQRPYEFAVLMELYRFSYCAQEITSFCFYIAYRALLPLECASGESMFGLEASVRSVLILSIECSYGIKS